MVVEEKEDDGIGLPHIVVDCSDKSTPVYQKVIGCGKFPSMEEVWTIYWQFLPSFVLIVFLKSYYEIGYFLCKFIHVNK